MYFEFELTQLINSQPFVHSDDRIVVLNACPRVDGNGVS